jgi:excinuclease ABC subunit B
LIYISATPGDYEREHADQIVEQIVRPTGLVDPEVIIKPVTATRENSSQIDDLMDRIHDRIAKNERCLVTTLTKKMAEDLSEYLKEKKIKVRYLHSDINTLERIQIITDLRQGEIEVIVGVNLLREGLDMPEVSLVAILDGDKEGFLRNDTSLIQTIGRAARNANGQVLIYADHITDSIKRAISETDRRRKIQLQYNKNHGITPKTIEKSIRNILEEFGLHNKKSGDLKSVNKPQINKYAKALQIELETDKRPIAEIIKEKEKQMKEAAKALEFELAAVLRDELRVLKTTKLPNATKLQKRH